MSERLRFARTLQYINETALFKNQWQLKTASQADYVRLVEEKFRPILRKLEDEVCGFRIVRTQGRLRVFPRSGDGNDVIVYEPPRAKARAHCGTRWHDGLPELLRFTFPTPARRPAALDC